MTPQNDLELISELQSQLAAANKRIAELEQSKNIWKEGYYWVKGDEDKWKVVLVCDGVFWSMGSDVDYSVDELKGKQVIPIPEPNVKND